MLDKFNEIYTKLIYEWSNSIESDYFNAKKEYEEVNNDINHPRHKELSKLYSNLEELESLYKITLGKIPWGDLNLSKLYVKYVKYMTDKDPRAYNYEKNQFVELKNATDMSTKLYYITFVLDDLVKLEGVKLKQQPNGVWKAQTKKYEHYVYGLKELCKDIDDEGNYCLTNYKRFYQIIGKSNSRNTEIFYPIENIENWAKQNNVNLTIEKSIAQLTDDEVCKNWGTNPNSPEFSYAFDRHKEMKKENPELHKETSEQRFNNNYETTTCSCGFKYSVDMS